MAHVIVRRVAVMIPVLLLVSLVTFALVLLVPGDPAITLAGEGASLDQIAATRDRLGLDDPLAVQYGRWLGSVVRGDLGTSLFSSQTVLSAIADRLPATLSLAGGALVVSLVVGIPAGIVAAVWQGRWIDRVFSIGVAGGLAMPNYFFAMLLLLVFAIWNRGLPASGYVALTEDPGGWARHLLLPWLTLGISSAAVIARQLRGAMIGVLSLDYIRTARAKGLRPGPVYFKHAAKNAAIPVLTVVGGQVAYALGGSVVIEQVFGIAGIGRLIISAVFTRDLPTIQGIVMVFTAIVLVCNLAIDVSYAYFNPKVRIQ